MKRKNPYEMTEWDKKNYIQLTIYDALDSLKTSGGGYDMADNKQVKEKENNMQDRFKFRYRFDNKLYEVQMVDFGQEYVYFKMPDDKVCTRAKLDYKSLVQCTGLKDKNSKLIYEGDIVKVFHISSSGQIWLDKGVVEYNKIKAGFEIVGNGGFYSDDVYEIIGNIYENKELLGVADEQL